MSWYRLDLGDALLAEGKLDDIRGRCRAAFEQAGAPAGWAVYLLHVSGDLHCRAEVFFSPACSDLAQQLGAQPCGSPPQGITLLAGDEAGRDCRSRS